MLKTFVLVVAFLNVKGSYRQNSERPAEPVPEPVQFWFSSENVERVRTFAVEHDIHCHNIGLSEDGSRYTSEEAQAHLKRIYGEVLERIVVLEFSGVEDETLNEQVLRSNGLEGRLEISKAGDWAFYNPDSGDYRTQSEPRALFDLME